MVLFNVNQSTINVIRFYDIDVMLPLFCETSMISYFPLASWWIGLPNSSGLTSASSQIGISAKFLPWNHITLSNIGHARKKHMLILYMSQSG